LAAERTQGTTHGSTNHLGTESLDLRPTRDRATGQHHAHRAAAAIRDHERDLALDLTTLGLASSSFGEWQGVAGGESAEVLDEPRYRYLNLQFDGDRLVGANCVGFSDHVGALRGLIEGRLRLGVWKQRLMDNPAEIMPAYLAAAGTA